MKKDITIRNNSFDFAVKIISLYSALTEQKEFILSKQLLCNETSIGANIEESTAAQFANDFIHKQSVLSEKVKETKYWLMLLSKSQLVNIDYSSYLYEVDEIINILTVIIKNTSRKKFKIQNPKLIC